MIIHQWRKVKILRCWAYSDQHTFHPSDSTKQVLYSGSAIVSTFGLFNSLTYTTHKSSPYKSESIFSNSLFSIE